MINIKIALADFYYLDHIPAIQLVYINKNILWIILSVIIIAPVTILLSAGQFSRQKIYKSLKEN